MRPSLVVVLDEFARHEPLVDHDDVVQTLPAQRPHEVPVSTRGATKLDRVDPDRSLTRFSGHLDSGDGVAEEGVLDAWSVPCEAREFRPPAI